MAVGNYQVVALGYRKPVLNGEYGAILELDAVLYARTKQAFRSLLLGNKSEIGIVPITLGPIALGTQGLQVARVVRSITGAELCDRHPEAADRSSHRTGHIVCPIPSIR